MEVYTGASKGGGARTSPPLHYTTVSGKGGGSSTLTPMEFLFLSASILSPPR